MIGLGGKQTIRGMITDGCGQQDFARVSASYSAGKVGHHWDVLT